MHRAIGFSFDSDWLKNWSFKPITKRRNRNHVITFESQLKTALTIICHANTSKIIQNKQKRGMTGE